MRPRGWDLTNHVKLAMSSDVTDDNEDGWLAKEVDVKGIAIAVRKRRNATIASSRPRPREGQQGH